MKRSLAGSAWMGFVALCAGALACGAAPSPEAGADDQDALDAMTHVDAGPPKKDASPTDGASSPDGAPASDAATDGAAPPPPGPSGKALVFSAPFSDATQWTIGRSSAYPGTTNPGDNKLDVIGPASKPSADGTFHAKKRADGKWDADLVTTEYSQGAFELKPNDVLDATVTLGPELGAWPAIWTWGRDLAGKVQPGHGEVDLFEYHPDNANLLELTNHVGGAGSYFTNAAVAPNKAFQLRVVFGTTSVDWYVNGAVAFADKKGVPASWTAYPVVNLSVCAGKFHPAPNGTAMSFRVENFRVYR